MFDYGELRSILARKPSEQAWEALTSLLGDATQLQLQDQLLPYLEQPLKRWPTQLRVAPLAWLDRAISGEPCVQLKLVRRLNASLLSADELISITRRGCFDGLEGFELGQLVLFPDAFEAWLEAAQGWRLRDLALGGRHITDEQVKLLSQHPMSEGLERLELNAYALSERGVRCLGCSPTLRGLRALVMRRGTLSTAACHALASAAHLPQLRELELSHSNIGYQGIASLLKDASWSKTLETLTLAGSALAPGDTLKLKPKQFEKLTRLSLSRARVAASSYDNDDARAEVSLVFGHALPSLEHLDLSHAPRGIDVMLRTINNINYHYRSIATTLTRLRTLDLRGNRLSDHSVAHLSTTGLFSSLERLELSDELLTRAQRKVLAESHVLRSSITSWYKRYGEH